MKHSPGGDSDGSNLSISHVQLFSIFSLTPFALLRQVQSPVQWFDEQAEKDQFCLVFGEVGKWAHVA